MRKSIVLALTESELIELYRIIVDGDKEGALNFLQEHLKERVHQMLEGLGHCRPWFETPRG